MEEVDQLAGVFNKPRLDVVSSSCRMVAIVVPGQYETCGFGAISGGILYGILELAWLVWDLPETRNILLFIFSCNIIYSILS